VDIFKDDSFLSSPYEYSDKIHYYIKKFAPNSDDQFFVFSNQSILKYPAYSYIDKENKIKSATHFFYNFKLMEKYKSNQVIRHVNAPKDTNLLFIDKYFLKIQIFLLLIILVFNSINYAYLGDSGVYFVSFISSFIIIDFINNNSSISPYLGVLLLWYPCFENLFSIIRRLRSSKKTYQSDNYHLHHLIYLFFLKKNVLYPSNFTGASIFFFNLIVFFLGCRLYDKTVYLLFLIFTSIFIYCYCYFYFRKLLKKK
jgi:hypothetical protein